jgi:hypothetical protein
MDPYLITMRVRERVSADTAAVLKATTGAFEQKHKLLVLGTKGGMHVYYGSDVNKHKPEDWLKVAKLGLLYVERFEDRDVHVLAADFDALSGAVSLPELLKDRMARRSHDGKAVEQPVPEPTHAQVQAALSLNG